MKDKCDLIYERLDIDKIIDRSYVSAMILERNDPTEDTIETIDFLLESIGRERRRDIIHLPKKSRPNQFTGEFRIKYSQEDRLELIKRYLIEGDYYGMEGSKEERGRRFPLVDELRAYQHKRDGTPLDKVNITPRLINDYCKEHGLKKLRRAMLETFHTKQEEKQVLTLEHVA